VTLGPLPPSPALNPPPPPSRSSLPSPHAQPRFDLCWRLRSSLLWSCARGVAGARAFQARHVENGPDFIPFFRRLAARDASVVQLNTVAAAAAVRVRFSLLHLMPLSTHLCFCRRWRRFHSPRCGECCLCPCGGSTTSGRSFCSP
jgi:hypothetical protein